MTKIITKESIFAIIFFLVFSILGCSKASVLDVSESVPTTILAVITPLTPTRLPTITPSSTFTPMAVSRLIPTDYYRVVKTKSTVFHNGEVKTICIQTNTHRATKIISDNIIEVEASSEYEPVVGDCFGSYPKQWNYQLDIYNGEFTQSLEQASDSTIVYFGKNYNGNQETVFSLSSTPVSVWKITTPISHKDVLDKITIYEGTEESLVDKATGILIYQIESFKYIQDPTYTYIIETISLSTNATIGGVLSETDFAYSKE